MMEDASDAETIECLRDVKNGSEEGGVDSWSWDSVSPPSRNDGVSDTSEDVEYAGWSTGPLCGGGGEGAWMWGVWGACGACGG